MSVSTSFDEERTLADVAALALDELERFAAQAAREIRRGAPGGPGGRMARGVRVFKNYTGLVIYIPRPGRFLEFGHDVVVGGRKVGHAPPRPFVRQGIIRAAQRFGESYGGAVGEYAGGYVGSSLGPVGKRVFGGLGRKAGAARGRQVWTSAGEKSADMLEAGTLRQKAGHGLELAGGLASGVTARREGP